MSTTDEQNGSESRLGAAGTLFDKDLDSLIALDASAVPTVLKDQRTRAWLRTGPAHVELGQITVEFSFHKLDQ